MDEPPVPARLERLRDERRAARRRALAYLGGSAVAGAIGLAHLVGPRAASVAALCALAAALWWLAIEHRAAVTRRRLLDDLILHGWRAVAPAAVSEREGELVARRNRRLLARALENHVVGTFGQTPVFLPRERPIMLELRREAARIHAVAGRLRDDHHVVDPRGVLLVAQLLSDGASPIHAGPTREIAPALERIERALDRAA